jgi:hypothetical protein
LRYWYSVAAILVAGMLAACVRGDIPTDPEAFSMSRFSVSEVRPSQTVAINNGYTAESRQYFQRGSQTLAVDAQQLTQTAVTMLRQALEKQGLTIAPQAEKAITLRVVVQSMTFQEHRIRIATTRVKVVLEAQGADGTRILADAENASTGSAQQALDGAVSLALSRLAGDEKFLAYMNR